MVNAELAAVSIEDDAFAAHLRNAVRDNDAVDAAVLVDLQHPELRQGLGDREGIEMLRAMGVALFRPDQANAAELDFGRQVMQGERLRVWMLEGCQVMLLAGEDATLVLAFTPGTAFDILLKECDRLRFNSAVEAEQLFARLSEFNRVGRALLQIGHGAARNYCRVGTEHSQDWRTFDGCSQSHMVAEARRWVRGEPSHADCRNRIQGATLVSDVRSEMWLRVPFRPNLLIGLSASKVIDISAAAGGLANDVLRELIGRVLAAGLQTQITPFPHSNADFEGLLKRLRALAPDDLTGRLDLGGFANHPIGEGEDRMRCAECIYFLTHRRWCDLPELPIPVEPDWFCRLWRM